MPEHSKMRSKQEIELGLLRTKQILDLLNVSRSHWWQGVRDGRYPPPIKLSMRVTCWKVSDIRRLIEERREAK